MSKILSRRETSILRALGETLFPARAAPPPIDYVEAFMSRISTRDRWLIRASLMLFEHGMVTHRHGNLRFSTAPSSMRSDYLAYCESSDVYLVRVGFLALRSLVTMAYVPESELAR